MDLIGRGWWPSVVSIAVRLPSRKFRDTTRLKYRCQRGWWVLWKALTGNNAELNAKAWEKFTAVKHKWGSTEVYCDLFGLHSIFIPFGVTIKFPYNKRTRFADIFCLHLELFTGLPYSSCFSLRWYESLQCSTENTNIKREWCKKGQETERNLWVFKCFSLREPGTPKSS